MFNIKYKFSNLPIRSSFISNTKSGMIKNFLILIVQNKISSLLDVKTKNKSIVFSHTGQGSQYHGMGKNLYEMFDIFKKSMDKCDRLFSNYIDKSIIELLFNEKLIKICLMILFTRNQ